MKTLHTILEIWGGLSIIGFCILALHCYHSLTKKSKKYPVRFKNR